MLSGGEERRGELERRRGRARGEERRGVKMMGM